MCAYNKQKIILMNAITYWKSNNISKYDFLVLAASALYWKKYNGSITLYTTKHIHDILLKFDMLDIWDVVNVDVLTNIDTNINESIYSNASFNYIIDEQTIPFVFIHPTIIVLKHIVFDENADIVVPYKEQLHYPYKTNYNALFNEDDTLKDKYPWIVQRDITFNTKLVYFNNLDIIKDYNEDAFTYIKTYNDDTMRSKYNNRQTLINNQLLYIVAQKYKYSTLAIDILIRKFSGDSWIYDETLSSNIEELLDYYFDYSMSASSTEHILVTLIRVLRENFPDESELLIDAANNLNLDFKLNDIKQLF